MRRTAEGENPQETPPPPSQGNAITWEVGSQGRKGSVVYPGYNYQQHSQVRLGLLEVALEVVLQVALQVVLGVVAGCTGGCWWLYWRLYCI